MKNTKIDFRTKLQVIETEKEIKIRELQIIDGDIVYPTLEHIFKKEEFITNEVLKRMPLETLQKTKERIEQEIQERNIGVIKELR